MGDGNVQSVCLLCPSVFKRIQELKRHIRDKHMDRRRCPFCTFRWTRPNNIKVHIISKHAERFTAELLEAIRDLRGRQVIAFVDGYDNEPDLPMSDHCNYAQLPGASTLLSCLNTSSSAFPFPESITPTHPPPYFLGPYSPHDDTNYYP
jgi:hypothetical protein